MSVRGIRMWSVLSVVLFSLILVLSVFPACAPAAQTPPAAAPTATATPPKPANPEILMSSTTSTRDSGLMDVLIPIFQQKTGYVLKPVYVGSGQAMTMGQ